jgi:hypothetical protein
VSADSLDSVERIRQTLSGESESRKFAGVIDDASHRFDQQDV